MMTPVWQFWFNWVVQLAIAIGTLGAVIVALFGHWLRSHVAPPQLKLSLSDARGVRTPTTLIAPDGTTRQTESRWYHVRVENQRRWSPATQVQVYLLRIEEPDASGQYKLTWVGEIPIKWRDQEVHALSRTIGYAADCDLCSVVKEKWIEIHPLIPLIAIRAQRRGECHMILTLQARSIETDSSLLRVKIDWNGEWAEDSQEMARRMVVEIVT